MDSMLNGVISTRASKFTLLRRRLLECLLEAMLWNRCIARWRISCSRRIVVLVVERVRRCLPRSDLWRRLWLLSLLLLGLILSPRRRSNWAGRVVRTAIARSVLRRHTRHPWLRRAERNRAVVHARSRKCSLLFRDLRLTKIRRATVLIKALWGDAGRSRCNTRHARWRRQ